MPEEFDFEKVEGEFDGLRIMYEEMAKIVIPMFRSYLKGGLSVPEAAALTAAIIAHTLPTKEITSQED